MANDLDAQLEACQYARSIAEAQPPLHRDRIVVDGY